jgi:hypothetical protein
MKLHIAFDQRTQLATASRSFVAALLWMTFRERASIEFLPSV